jgi:aminoglycoside phosphotransferase (APT) family kinase protein
MDASGLERAKAAAISVAASLGLAADDAIVVHNSNRVALRLTPCDVLARVAPPEHDAAPFEVDRAQRLAEVGSPVGLVAPGLEPRVYTHDDFMVTLWTYYEPAKSPIPPADYAEALERLHVGMRKLDGPTPRFTDRIAEAQESVADPRRSPDLADADREFLSGRLAHLHQAIVARGAVEQLLHGEPHPGNVLSTENGPLFIDLETCCRGPVEFDLAHAPVEICEHYPNVDQELLDDCRHVVIAMVTAWRWELGDDLPNRDLYREVNMRALHDGPPWPTLDELSKRVEESGPSLG